MRAGCAALEGFLDAWEKNTASRMSRLVIVVLIPLERVVTLLKLSVRARENRDVILQ